MSSSARPALSRFWIALCFATALIGALPPAQAADAQGSPAAQQHRGPAVWIEEYWDVKPGRLDDFVRTYRKEVYSITRRMHGYRGYTVLTNIPDANGQPRAGRNHTAMLSPHYGIHLQGKILTERSIDVGVLLRQTHNVVVIHHLQDWADARAFRQGMAALYAREHGGQSLWDHLAVTLFPLANNYWETDYRMIETGLSIPAARPGRDADGLDLEPHPSNTGWFKEYFDVLPKDVDRFLDVYRHNTLAVMKPLPGYQGVSFVTNLPPGAEEAKRSKYRGERLGGPDSFYVHRPGVMMDGVIRTDTSINYSMLFRKTFTIITYYQLPWKVKMMQGMQKNFERTNPGQDRIKYITKVFFPLVQNHWDMWYRAIETSFVPTDSQ